jgi:hypothetical protein
MTIAVCLKCGEFKRGAWTPCIKCGYTPDDDESYTKHLLVSDHNLSREDLEGVASRVKSGEPIEFPPEVLKQAWVSKDEVDRANRGCSLGCIAALLVIIAVAVILVVWRLQ